MSKTSRGYKCARGAMAIAMRWPVLALSYSRVAPAPRRSSTRSITPITVNSMRSSSFSDLAHHVCVWQSRCVSTTTVAALPLIVDPVVASTSLNSSFNLVALCGFIILLQKYGHLPSNTALVLSQVSFNLVIPCFLMAKVSSTIAAHRDWTFLSLPLMSLVQIAIGGILGRLASTFLYGRLTSSSGQKNNDVLVKEALVTAACAFGNTVTLPLVFLNGMLSHTDYSIAAGYLALYMVGWSPCLWTLGYKIMSSTSGRLDKTSNHNSNFSLNKLVDGLKQLMNPPLYGVLIGVLVGATPMSYLFLPTKHKMLLAHASNTRSFLLSTCSMMSSILQPIFEGATLLGSATVPLQAIVLASTLANSIKRDEAQQVTANGSMIVLEGKAFWVISVIRLVLMPLIFLTLLHAIQHRGWFPTDPLSKFSLLVQASTRPFAGVLANLLVRQYLAAVVSLTLWMPIFYSFLRLG